MNRGVTVENPYASVTIPRAQLKDSFLRYYLGEDLTSDTVLYNPSHLPTYSAAQEKDWEATQPPPPAQPQPRPAAYVPWDGQQKIQTQESWARPYNPYASLKMPSGESLEPFHWKSHEAAAPAGASGDGAQSSCCCCCPCCAKCCSCCRRCPCVIS